MNSIRTVIQTAVVLTTVVLCSYKAFAGTLRLQVRDAASGAPVQYAHISLPKAHIALLTQQNGVAYISDLRSGVYSIVLSRVGYERKDTTITLSKNDTLSLDIYLTPLARTSQNVVVEQEKRAEWKSVVQEMSGSELREQASRTIAESLAGKPGIDFRSMGAAPARPVIRGLGSDRLLLTEDGERTGDLSATSADHAVAIEPLTAQKIEVIRGAGAFLYGSNVLGGVVNVERGTIPTLRPDHIHGGITVQGESVNNGIGASGNILLPVTEDIALKADASWREAADLQTPAGVLGNTAIATKNASLGGTVFLPGARIGAAVGLYDSRYGIPGGFVGAHPFGVGIEMDRLFYEIKADFHPENSSWIDRIEAQHRFSRFSQQEYERGGALGASFSVLTGVGLVNIFLQNSSIFRDGVLQARIQHRSAAFGGFVFAPDTDEWTPSITYLQTIAFSPEFSIQAALRADAHVVIPSEERESRIGTIKRRTFAGISGATTFHWQPSEQWDIDFTATRAFRPPTLEELFSEGPHLAAYSFEVGNPTLNAETALGIELSVSWQTDILHIETSLFRNSFQNFLFPRNTGDTNWRTLLPIFQYTALPVIMSGGEIMLESSIWEHITISATVSGVYAEFTASGEAPPFIPPVNGSLQVRYHTPTFEAGIRLQGAAAQRRIDVFELPTDGFAVLGGFIEYRLMSESMMYTFTLTAENILNTEYRRHLSRVKEVMPEPGTNLRLLLKAYF